MHHPVDSVDTTIKTVCKALSYDGSPATVPQPACALQPRNSNETQTADALKTTHSEFEASALGVRTQCKRGCGVAGAPVLRRLVAVGTAGKQAQLQTTCLQGLLMSNTDM